MKLLRAHLLIGSSFYIYCTWYVQDKIISRNNENAFH